MALLPPRADVVTVAALSAERPFARSVVRSSAVHGEHLDLCGLAAAVFVASPVPRRLRRRTRRRGCGAEAVARQLAALERHLDEYHLLLADGTVQTPEGQVKQLAELEGSVQHLAVEVTLPGQLQPIELLSLVRSAVRTLRIGGKLYFATTWGCNGPLRPLLQLPELSLEVCIWPPEDGLWPYVCTHLEAPPEPKSALQLVVQVGEDENSSIAVWTTNPEEALFEYEEIYLRRCYIPLGASSPLSSLQAAAWQRFVESSRPKVVVDAGMNLGLFTRFAWEVFQPSRDAGTLTCLAFEPAPEVFRMALRSCKEGGLPVISHAPDDVTWSADGSVHIFQLALSDTSGVKSFTHFPASPANSALTQHNPSARWPEGQVPSNVELKVSCCRLSEILGDQIEGVDIFLKVDVEGAEVQLLQGLDEKHWDAIFGIAMEVSGVSLTPILQLCKDHSLEVEYFKQPSSEAQDLEELFMVYACRGEKKATRLPGSTDGGLG